MIPFFKKSYDNFNAAQNNELIPFWFKDPKLMQIQTGIIK